MKSPLSPIEKLDKVLYYIKVHDAIEVIMLPKFLESRQIILSANELRRICLQLLEDHYIFLDGISYSITFKGFIFVETGGYDEEIKQKKINNEINETVQSLKLTNDNRLVLGTFFAGIAALLLFGWQVWIWVYPSHKDFVHRNDIETHVKAK